jgi:hypothetical protein
MKIHSDYRDYYDIGLSVGVDTTLHYNRKQRWFYLSEIKTKLPPETIRGVRLARNLPEQPDIERIVVGFCGVLYPAIRVIRSEKDSETLYAPEELDKHFKFSGVPSWGRPSEHWEKNFRKRQRERAEWLSNSPRCDDLFLELDEPVFVAQVDRDGEPRDSIEIVANEPLRPFQFFKVVDPYSAFQEVSMYLGNQLVKHDTPDEIADEYRIAMHGYDKHSFRHPTRTIDLE